MKPGLRLSHQTLMNFVDIILPTKPVAVQVCQHGMDDVGVGMALVATNALGSTPDNLFGATTKKPLS